MKTVMFVLFSFSRGGGGGGGVADFIVSFACANLVATLTCITSASRLASLVSLGLIDIILVSLCHNREKERYSTPLQRYHSECSMRDRFEFDECCHFRPIYLTQHRLSVAFGHLWTAQQDNVSTQNLVVYVAVG